MSEPINLFDYEILAKQNLEPMVLDYYQSGALDEITLKENRLAINRYQLRPRMLVDVSQRDLTTTVVGQSLAMPVLIAPMAFQCLANPEGEIATAKAAANKGVVMVLSTMSTKSLEAVAEQKNNTHQWFQLYIHRDRALTQALVQRAENAGYNALCLTIDAPMLGKRESDRRNQFTLPKTMELANLVSMADLAIPQTTEESGLFTYFAEQIDPSVTWKDVEWLQSITTLPVILKGILRADDALKAYEFGAKGIIVSNHGGRQLDGAIATFEALPEIVAAVGDKIDILIDGGIRRGSDVLKALALGATAVSVGRPILWGLAVAGEKGVARVLELLQQELDLAMALSGCASIEDIDSSLVMKIR
ncbi:MAG: alpha-hydroxy acid oxidase [Xenococcaceae cyanobacterium]